MPEQNENCENVKAIYQHILVDEVANNFTPKPKSREIVIVSSFDPCSVEEIDDCSANHYILAHEYCNTDAENVTTVSKRHFVSYEALKSTAPDGNGCGCSGSSLISINKHADYSNIVTEASGWNVQGAIEQITAKVATEHGGGGSSLRDANNQVNLGSRSQISKSQDSTIVGGDSNKITEYSSHSAIVSGEGNVISDFPNSFIGAGEKNKLIKGDLGFIGSGSKNKVENAACGSVLNGVNNSVVKDYGVVLTGKNGFVENVGEVAISSEVDEEKSANVQTSTMLMNTITEGLKTNEMFLSDVVSAERITIPLKGNNAKRKAGSLTGTLTLSGLYVYGEESDLKSSTVVANYAFAAMATKDGKYKTNLSAKHDSVKLKADDDSVELDISNVNMSTNNDKLVINVQSNVEGEVLWTASVNSNRLVKD